MKLTKPLASLALAAIRIAPSAITKAMPAPRSVTTAPIVGTKSRSSGGARSASNELCLPGAVLQEGRHADGLVLGGEESRELLLLDVQAGTQVDLEAGVDADLRSTQRQGG